MNRPKMRGAALFGQPDLLRAFAKPGAVGI